MENWRKRILSVQVLAVLLFGTTAARIGRASAQTGGPPNSVNQRFLLKLSTEDSADLFERIEGLGNIREAQDPNEKKLSYERRTFELVPPMLTLGCTRFIADNEPLKHECTFNINLEKPSADLQVVIDEHGVFYGTSKTKKASESLLRLIEPDKLTYDTYEWIEKLDLARLMVFCEKVGDKIKGCHFKAVPNTYKGVVEYEDESVGKD